MFWDITFHKHDYFVEQKTEKRNDILSAITFYYTRLSDKCECGHERRIVQFKTENEPKFIKPEWISL